VRFTPATVSVSDCPCDLLVVIAKETRRGNCRRLNSKCTSVGMSGIRGMNTMSLRAVPLHGFGASRLHSVILLSRQKTRQSQKTEPRIKREIGYILCKVHRVPQKCPPFIFLITLSKINRF